MLDERDSTRNLAANVCAEPDAAGTPSQIGWSETFYDAKRDILRKKYGLRWKRPKE